MYHAIGVIGIKETDIRDDTIGKKILTMIFIALSYPPKFDHYVKISMYRPAISKPSIDD
jgi:hypothetical protein